MKKHFLFAALVAAIILPGNANAEHRHSEHGGHRWERSHHGHHHYRHHRHHNDVWFHSTYISAPQPYYYYTTYYEPRPVYVVQRPAPVYVAPQPMFSLGLFVR